MILHIDMDAFFASIEQAINPRLKNRPLIVGSRNNPLHTVVCAASYEAKAMGIDSGMPSQEAFKLCPQLAFVPSDQSKYIWTSEQIFALLKSYRYTIAYPSIDEFQLDAPQGLNHLGLAKEIQKRIQEAFNISASIGIAQNCLLAKLASKVNKPKGIVIFKDDSLEDALSQIPAEKLCGVGEKTSLTLRSLGVESCLQLYQCSPGFLEQYLGKYGLGLWQSLHAKETLDEPEEREIAKSIGHSYTLPMASENRGFIRAWIRLLSEMVASRLRQNDLVAATVCLWLNSPQAANFNAQKTYQQATQDGQEIFQRCLKIMAKLGQKQPKIRAIGVTCSNLTRSKYPPLFKEQKRREELLSTIDKINSRYGEGAIFPAVITQAKKYPKK